MTPKTIRYQCRTVCKTYWHRCGSVQTHRHWRVTNINRRQYYSYSGISVIKMSSRWSQLTFSFNVGIRVETVYTTNKTLQHVFYEYLFWNILKLLVILTLLKVR